MTNFWKHAESYDDVEKPLHDLLAWLDREAEIGDFVVLEGDERLVKAIAKHAKAHRLICARDLGTRSSDPRSLIACGKRICKKLINSC